MKQKLFDKFAELFGSAEGARFYFSPGRVNLIGEHTDYNGGHVFPCALTMGTYGAARKRDDRLVHFYSMNLDNFGVVEASLDDLTNKNAYNWANYPLGVVWAFAEKGHPIDTGFDMVIWGNIPNGSGLSSSASLEVLTGVILTDLFGITDLTMTDLALIGQYSENNFNGCNCGIMDQFAVAMGKKDNAIFLDTNTMKYEYAPIHLEDAKIVITNSKVKHSLVDSAYNDRRRECTEALAALKTKLDITALGDLTGSGWSEQFMSDENGKQFIWNMVSGLIPVSDITPPPFQVSLERGNLINRLSVTAELEEGQTVRGRIVSTDGEMSLSLNTGEGGTNDCYVQQLLDASTHYSRCVFVLKQEGIYEIILDICDAEGNAVLTLSKQ